MTIHTHQRTTGRLVTLSVAVLLCTGCHHVELCSVDRAAPNPAVMPIGAGYSETNWAPLMTIDNVIHSEIILEEPPEIVTPQAEIIETPTVSDGRFDGNPRRTYQPLTSSPTKSAQQTIPAQAQVAVPAELARNIERNFSRALNHNGPVTSEQPRLLRGHPEVHVSRPPSMTLSQMIHANRQPVQRASHSEASDHHRRSVVQTAGHVDTILELLHSDQLPEATDRGQ